jgi:outer membrane protein assembly factor BamB
MLLLLTLISADWPRLLGPAADGCSTETGLLAPWPKAGLLQLWACPLGVGYAPPSVAAGNLYHFDRSGDMVRLTRRDAATGTETWKVEFPTAYEDQYGYEPGPRAGPVIDGDRVYVYGADGLLACVSTTGKVVWQLDTRAAYRFHQNFFGVGSVPWVEGNLLLVAVGGSPPGPRPTDLRQARPNGSCVVAFDKLTGQERWRVGDDLASYASPTVATIAGKRTGLYFARGGLLGFDPATGAERFRFPWRARTLESVNAANPVVVGDRVMLTECYGPGAVLLDLSGPPRAIWSDALREAEDKAMLAHWATPVHHNGFVYGSSGRHANEADLRCIDLATGAVKWVERRTTRCTLLKADGHLISLGEGGELRLIRLNPERYEEVSRWEMPSLGYPCWAPPVLSDGRLYVRGRGDGGNRLVCLKLTP